jgi:thymidylate synthase
MFQTQEATTANELWKLTASWFQMGNSMNQASRNGPTKEVMHAALTLNDPRQRWIAARVPALNPAFAIAEVVWILSGRNDSAMLNYFNPILPNFAGSGDTYHGAYGHRIRKRFGLDQLERAYQVLSTNPETRQIVLQIWDSSSDLPDEVGVEASKDVPCNICSMVKIRNGKLVWTQIMRSNDLFRGLPHNLIQFTTLQEILAGWLGLEVGSYHHFSDSLHLYDKDGDVFDHLEEVAPPENNDNLGCEKFASDRAFGLLGQLCDLCACSKRSAEDVLEFTLALCLPQGHYNLALILASDSLRRRGKPKLLAKLRTECSNPCLEFMLQRWLSKPRG